MAGLINRPLKRLSYAASQVRDGHFHTSTLDESAATSEIREVNIGFNRMAERLAKIEAERALMLAARVAKLVALKRSQRQERKVAIVLFNFPPNAGNIGSAAYLSVFESLWHTLTAMKAQGYQVEVPASVDDLRDALLQGNAKQYGADANVHALISADEHVKRER
eukprot:gene40737-64687_t